MNVRILREGDHVEKEIFSDKMDLKENIGRIPEIIKKTSNFEIRETNVQIKIKNMTLIRQKPKDGIKPSISKKINIIN